MAVEIVPIPLFAFREKSSLASLNPVRTETPYHTPSRWQRGLVPGKTLRARSPHLNKAVREQPCHAAGAIQGPFASERVVPLYAAFLFSDAIRRIGNGILRRLSDPDLASIASTRTTVSVTTIGSLATSNISP